MQEGGRIDMADSSLNIIDVIEEEETKRSKARSKKKKKKTRSNPSTKGKLKPKVKEVKADSESDTNKTAKKKPPEVEARKIRCKEVNNPNVAHIELKDIKGTSQSIYVDDIHHANPTVLETIYWVNLKDNRWVIARVPKEDYDYIVQKTGKRIAHHVTVVDCSVLPTLSYGSWQFHELTDAFPSAKQIEEQDRLFRENPTNFHNAPVKIELIREKAASKEDDNQEDEELDLLDEDEEELSLEDEDELLFDDED